MVSGRWWLLGNHRQTRPRHRERGLLLTCSPRVLLLLRDGGYPHGKGSRATADGHRHKDTATTLMRNHCSSPMVSELYEFGKQGDWAKYAEVVLENEDGTYELAKKVHRGEEDKETERL